MSSTLRQRDRDRAEALGADTLLRSKRYRELRERFIFPALDGLVELYENSDVPNPYDVEILGAHADLVLSEDPKLAGYLKQRKVEALKHPTEREELFRLAGLLVAEQYIASRRERIPPETKLSRPVGIVALAGTTFAAMRDAGRAMAAVDVYANELSVTYPGVAERAVERARRAIAEAVQRYEDIVPETDDNEIPDEVERRAISIAAFLRLTADELQELAVRENLPDDLSTKAAIASALAEKYGDDLDRVAELVLRRAEGNPDYGLVTRLLPLDEPPDIGSAETIFTSLEGRYFETRTAVFFLFGDVRRAGNVLRVEGRIHSFTVNPADAGGVIRMNARPHRESVVVVLRADQPWAEVDARRTSDLRVVRSVLRRSAAVVPAEAVEAPEPLTREPYDTWNPRTLWMLDFLRRDLQRPELRLDNTLMANFVTPTARNAPVQETEPEETEPDVAEDRRPKIDAVRLLGRQLHDHPEACERIAAGAQLRDLDILVRAVQDARHDISRLVRFRLSWEDDHLAVLSGVTDPDQFQLQTHQTLVRLVRQAAHRELNEEALRFMLRRIESRAAAGTVDEEGSVLDPPVEAEGA